MLALRPFLLLSLLSAPAAPHPLPPAAPFQDELDGKVQELLNAIRRRKDREIPPEQFQLFARIGTRKAFEGLKTCVEWLSKAPTLFSAYKALRGFADDEAFAQEAVEFLAEEAVDARRAIARIQAARALALWKARAWTELEEVVKEGREPAVRGHALRGLLPLLLERRDPPSLRLILDNIASEDVDRLTGELGRFDSPACRRVLLDFALDKRNDTHLRALVLEDLVATDDLEVEHALVRLVADRQTVVQLTAIDGLVRRGIVERARDRLWKLLTSRELDVRFTVVRALGSALTEDAKWKKRLFELAGGRDPATRMGAAYALRELGTEEALAALDGLLEDRDWRVRQAALENVETLRTPETVARLIGRLEAETGRLRVDVVRALQRLTGMRLGSNPAPWRAWWDDHREGYVVPPAAATDRAAEREAVEGASIATFYGLPVFSESVTFVLDKSGSMARKTGGFEGDYAEGGRVSRLGVARAELKALIGRIPDGNACNVVYFDDVVEAWEKEVRRMNERTRRELLEFVDRPLPKNGTNLCDAILFAMEDPGCDTIYVLSDGQPTSGEITQPDGIRRRVLQKNRHARVQFYGVSVGLVSELLEDLAEATGGRYVELGVPAEESNSKAREVLLRADATEEELAEALRRARDATRIDPRSSLFRTVLGIARFRTGDLDRARDDLAAAEGLEGSGEPALAATRLAFQARLEAREGRREEALALLVRARELLADRRDVEVRVFLDRAEAEIGS